MRCRRSSTKLYIGDRLWEECWDSSQSTNNAEHVFLPLRRYEEQKLIYIFFAGNIQHPACHNTSAGGHSSSSWSKNLLPLVCLSVFGSWSSSSLSNDLFLHSCLPWPSPSFASCTVYEEHGCVQPPENANPSAKMRRNLASMSSQLAHGEWIINTTPT